LGVKVIVAPLVAKVSPPIWH